MTLERADASYTAWDKAIVAKSKQTASAAQSGAATPRKDETQTAQAGTPSTASFKNALARSDDHERHYDATWRSTAAETGSGPAARDPDNEDFGFWDFVDIINPLQHIPVVATIYRELTGDEISAPARIMGGALYGGPLGFAASIGNAIMEEVTGKDAGEIAIAMVLEDESAGGEGAVLADTAATDPGSSQHQAVRGDAVNDPSPEREPAPSVQAVAAPENAGQAAVLQEMSGNAALQDLLKQMGLAPNGAAPANPGSAFAGQPGPISPIRPEAAAMSAVSLPDTARQDPVSRDQRRVAAQDTPAAQPRRSIAIDTSRYINPQAAKVQKPNASTAETTSVAAQNAAETRASAETAAMRTADKANGEAAEKEALQASFADRMLQALDRYQAMSKQKTALPSVDAAGQTSPRPGAI